MEENVREVVIPGEKLDIESCKPGKGVLVEGDEAYASCLGVKHERADYMNVIPLTGKYMPHRDDKIIGKIIDVGPTTWTVDINAHVTPNLHVNEVPWKVDFGDCNRFMKVGDVIFVKVSYVNEVKQVWLNMKDRGLHKLNGGYLMDITPTKVPRVIGKEGSMIKLIKEYTGCRIYVGQNGIIWIDGELDGILLSIKTIKRIEEYAHIKGLTDKIKEFLESEKKGD